MLTKWCVFLILAGTLCYDDRCHLKKYALNPTRKEITPTAARLAALNIVVDKMHFKGHTDSWCHDHCNPYNLRELDKVSSTLLVLVVQHTMSCLIIIYIQVDTQICEQTFSWMSRYSRITRHMNREHFLFYLLYISDLHNRKL